MPHWWEELTAIPEVGDVKRLAWKIHTPFDIPVIWCKALRNQAFTAPSAPKCLKRGVFLPNNSYQDVWLKPHIFTLAYVQALQHWAEEANPPTPGEPCPLVKSMIELRQCVGRYTTFSKHVFKSLGNAIPEA